MHKPTFVLATALAISSILHGAEVRAQEQGAKLPTTLPAAVTPATGPSLLISPEADALLNEVKAAYAALKTLDLNGTVSLEFDGAGQKQSNRADFDGSFAAPNKFRHETKDDILIVSTGEKTYVYQAASKEYVVGDSAKDRAAVSAIVSPVPAILSQQNPSLLLAASDDARRALTDGAEDISRGEDIVIEQISYPVLTYVKAGAQVRALIDPKTKLLRQVSVDMKQSLTASGMPQVNKAVVVVDYRTSVADGAGSADQFAWAPPADAKVTTLQNDQQPGQEAATFVGKPMPDFTLNDIDGKPVKLSDLKGSVVLLDFWATWCPPCVAGLPNMQKLNEEYSPKGMKFFAVNLQEDKPTIVRFLKQRTLNIPVLIDLDGALAGKLGIQSIPQKLVIGKDGILREAIIGESPDTEARLKQAVDTALK